MIKRIAIATALAATVLAQGCVPSKETQYVVVVAMHNEGINPGLNIVLAESGISLESCRILRDIYNSRSTEETAVMALCIRMRS